MNTNLDYIRVFCGERDEADPLFSDEELKALLSIHAHHEVTQRLARHLAENSVDYQELDAGLLRIRLRRLANVEGAYYAGVGNWLDDAYALAIDGVGYTPSPDDIVDTYGGRVVFATPPAEDATVIVETYLIDLRSVLVELLSLVRAARSRLALRTNLSGMSVDLTKVCERLQAEIDQLSSGYRMPVAPMEDYPH
ncbi:hypothetical protein J7J84_08185 [bacterium]|nr:hypothetical protein [bacterium]